MISPNVIAQAHSRDIREVAERLGAKLKKEGAERVGPCPVCGGRRDKLNIHPLKQSWYCRGVNDGADVIAFVQHVLGLDFHGAVEWLTDQRETPALKPRAISERLADPDEEEHRKLALAAEWWDAARPLGSEARDYFAKRGVDIDAVPDLGGLRWNPRCPWKDATAPCILARFTTATTNEPRGVWRRRIDNPAEKPRTLGPMRGCVIRLWPDDEVTLGLVVGEGVETVLAAATREWRGTLLQPAWALSGSGNLSAFPVLAGIAALTLLADHDENGAGEKAAETCAQRWLAAGVDVVTLTPKLQGDFNDLVQRERSA